MKTIIGAAIGVLALGLVLVGAGLRGTASGAATAATPSYAATPAGGVAVPVSAAGSMGTANGPVMVNCAPGQRALVRQVMLNGEAVSQVACVADPGYIADSNTGLVSLARPVSYPVARSTTVVPRRVVYQEPAPRQTVQAKRPWTKRLLVIGGSTATGAGIGGIIGGKKGALIGAALGGGASTIYEAAKR